MSQQHTILRVPCTPPTLDDALALAACGLQILACAPRTKQPARGLDDWQDLATTDPATLTAWWQTTPEANVGHVVQKNHLVLDIDPRHGGLTHWRTLLETHGDKEPVTWKTVSGRHDGGFHLHFHAEVDLVAPNTIDLAPGVQVLGPGHLAMLPPSLHPDTGQPYTWDAANNPLTVFAPAEVPTWLLNKIRWAHAAARDTAKKLSRPPTTKPSDDSLTLRDSTKVPEEGTPPLGTLVEGEAHTPSPKKGHGDHLLTLACDPRHLPALLGACGLPVTLQVGDSCRCPFHDDHTPSAWLRPPTETHRTYALYCFACQKYFALVDIYKQRRSANVLSLHTEQAGTGHALHHHTLRLMWTTRMLEEAGILSLHELGCPTVPPHAPKDMRDLWPIFLHVRRIRAATRDPDAQLPFTWRFVLDWAGRGRDWTQYQIQKAKCWGIAHGYWYADHGDAALTLWGIGRKDLRRARKAAQVFKTEQAARADVAMTEVVPMPEPSSACPDAHEFSHDARACGLCVQVRLLERRQQVGMGGNGDNPYGTRGVTWQPS